MIKINYLAVVDFIYYHFNFLLLPITLFEYNYSFNRDSYFGII